MSYYCYTSLDFLNLTVNLPSSLIELAIDLVVDLAVDLSIGFTSMTIQRRGTFIICYINVDNEVDGAANSKAHSEINSKSDKKVHGEVLARSVASLTAHDSS